MNSFGPTKGWEACQLGDVLDYVTSGSRDWSRYYSDSGALFVRTQDINTNRLTAAENIARVALPKSAEGKRTLIQRDDLLITITGANVGKCAVVEIAIPEAYVSQSVALVRLSETSFAHFIQKQLISPATDGEKTLLQQSAYGLGRPVLNLTNVRELPIRLAPLNEQKRIVDKLDTLLPLIESCREHLGRVQSLLKRFRHSVLAAATIGELTEDWRYGHGVDFPWPSVALRDAANSFSYGSAAKSSKEGDVPVLRMGNIQRGGLDWSDLVYTSDDREIEKYRLSAGDVLFNRTNSPELVGKAAVYRGERDAIYAGYLIRVRCRSVLLPDYLNYCLGSPAGRHYCWQVKSDGVSQSNINAKKLAAFEFGLPPIEEQAEIVRRVEALFALTAGIERRYEVARELVDRVTPALLAKAFRGELVPQDAKDEPASALLERIRERRADASAKSRRKPGSTRRQDP